MRHTRCGLVTVVQTCALPICLDRGRLGLEARTLRSGRRHVCRLRPLRDRSRPAHPRRHGHMRYRSRRGAETVAPISHEELWQRLRFFLTQLIPVAEEAGVRLAAHPDDPPADTLRRAARLVTIGRAPV